MGEGVNMTLRAHLVAELGKAGYPAVAPMASPLWKQYMSEKYLFASSWSERHAAYAAGLSAAETSDIFRGMSCRKDWMATMGFRISCTSPETMVPTAARRFDRTIFFMFSIFSACSRSLSLVLW